MVDALGKLGVMLQAIRLPAATVMRNGRISSNLQAQYQESWAQVDRLESERSELYKKTPPPASHI